MGDINLPHPRFGMRMGNNYITKPALLSSLDEWFQIINIQYLYKSNPPFTIL